jgi:uncharacterized protein (TIGR00369 family)
MKLNPQHLQELLKVINGSQYFRLLAMQVEEIGIGYAIVKMDINERHFSPYHAIQGGVYASLIDTACYWAVYAELEENKGLISIDVNVNNLASVNQGQLIIIGKRIKVGKSLCLAEAAIKDQANDRILAHGTSKLMVTEGLQTFDVMGTLNSINIPAKFI